jgi:hypothetical protein
VFKPIMLFVILGFRRGVTDVFALLRCNAASLDGYRRFGTACWTLGDGTVDSRNVGNYQSTLRNITEERRPQLCYCSDAVVTMEF